MRPGAIIDQSKGPINGSWSKKALYHRKSRGSDLYPS